MPTFLFQARDARGDEIEGTVVESDEGRALLRLRESQPGCTVTSLRAEERRARASVRRGVPKEELAHMFRQLGMAMATGLDVMRAVELLARSGMSPRLTSALSDMASDLSRGAYVSLALTRHPDLFSPSMVGLVELGEQTGCLPVVMERIAVMLERDAGRMRRVGAALTYPLMLMVASALMVGGLVVFFLPKMGEALRSFSAEPPASVRMALGLAEMAGNPAWVLLGIEVVVFFGVVGWLWLRSEVGREWFDDVVLRVPVVGRVMTCVMLSRLAYTIGMMVRSGGTTDQALRMAAGSLGNRVMGRAVEEARQYVLHGATLAQAVRSQPRMDLLFASMVEIGEESGRLDGMMEHLQRMYDEQLDMLLDGATTLMEPLILAFMGLMVGGAVLLFMVPMAQMVRTL